MIKHNVRKINTAVCAANGVSARSYGRSTRETYLTDRGGVKIVHTVGDADMKEIEPFWVARTMLLDKWDRLRVISPAV